LIGYCRLRNEYRDFRIDRLKQLVELDESFKTEHPPMKDYFNFIGNSKGMFKVVIQFPEDIAKTIAESKYYFGFLEEENKNGKIEMTFLCNTFDWIGNWLLSFGCNAHILEPLELKEIIRNKVRELSEFYSG
jgi:predicted DNA-binding transcriptional regulator YafY